MHAPKAVIEIGSTGIRLLVADPVEDNQNKKKQFNVLDRSDQHVSIGQDVYTNGNISRETLLTCIQVLNRYKEQLASYQIEEKDTAVIATSAIREAKNRDPFVDRIKVKTGFTVRVIDGIEENRLMYLAITDCLKEESLDVRNTNSIIIDISGGSTEMMLLEKGTMISAHTIRLGSVIIEQQMKSMISTTDDIQKFIEDFIRNTANNLKAEINLENVEQFIAVSSDMRIAALFSGMPVSPFLWEISRGSFEKFVEEIRYAPLEEIIAKFKVKFADAQTFKIALIAYSAFLKMTNVKTIIVPETSLREGYLLSSKKNSAAEIHDEFTDQIIASASSLLRKYKGDAKHANFVMNTSLKLYDAMQNELGLEDSARTLLAVSAILHDIGVFIQADNHNLHSKYIISNSEIFGLNRDEKNIVALITKFHKGSLMPQDDSEFKLLSRSSRLIILKLTAILRVADALDRGHRQNLTNYTIHLAQDTITLRIKGYKNLSLEKIAIGQKGDLFENVFGYKIVLI